MGFRTRLLLLAALVSLPVLTLAAHVTGTAGTRASLVALLALAALALAWIGGEILLVRPLRRMLETTRRIASLDPSSGAGAAPRAGEHAELAHAFEQMAETLARRTRRAELAEQRYRGLFERNLAGIFRTREGRFVDCNAAFAEIFGYGSPSELMERPVAELYADPEDRARLLADLAAGDSITRELRVLRKDGLEIWLLVKIVETRGENVVFREGMVVDITEHRRAEAALREREALLSSLVDNLPGGTIYQVVRRLDGTNYFPYISAGQSAVYGVTREQALADASLVYALLVEEDFKRLRAIADESLRTLTPMEVECRQRTPRGEERWVQIRGRPRRLPDGSTLWDAISLDVTERKRGEETRRDLEAQLQRLGDAAAGVAHAFNNLLTIVLGRAEGIRRAAPDAAVAGAAAQIEDAATQGAGLIQQMLADAGRALHRPRAVALAAVAEEATDGFHRTVAPDATVLLDTARDLPAVHADPVQLRQAVLALLINAHEAGADPKASIVIRTGVRRLDRAFLERAPAGADLPEADYAFVEVEDAGRGIDEATRARIFDPLFSTKVMGRGLGLPTVLGILRTHEGTVEVVSRPGHGTRVALLLPIRPLPDSVLD